VREGGCVDVTAAGRDSILGGSEVWPARTRQRYAEWVRRFVFYHGKRHPCDLGRPEIDGFLRYVAATEADSLRATELAREALVFLSEGLLHVDVGEVPIPPPLKLLDRLRHALRVRHYSSQTEETYAMWVERYVRFHGLRHPRDMGGAEVETFLTDFGGPWARGGEHAIRSTCATAKAAKTGS
jgi:hypothetical protein